MRYLPPSIRFSLLVAAPHFVAVFGTNLIYTVCLCIYRLFFGSCFSPAAAKRATDSFFCLSRSLAATSLPPSLSLIELPKKWVNCEPIFRHYCDNRCTRFSTTEREGERGRKKETAIITRATGKSENKTCHKINKAKKKLNRKTSNVKCTQNLQNSYSAR